MTLFKFLSAGGLDLIKNQRILCTPPERFKDPFELRPRFAASVAQRIWNEQFDKFKEAALAPELGCRQRKKQARALKKWAKQQITPLDVKQRLEDAATDQARRGRGIICFSAVVKENLLWYHYADGHRGFVIEFDCENDGFKQLGTPAEVTYSDTPPTYGPDERPSMDLFTIKPMYLNYEREYRVLRRLSDCTTEIAESGETTYYCDLPRGCIRAVYLGHRMDPECRSKILEILRGTSALSFEVCPGGHGYELEVRDVQP